MSDDIKIILFSIGNPGPSNRHSTGHIVLKKLINHYDATQLTKPSMKSLYSITRKDDLIFVKSNSYMNESSKAMKEFIEIERVNLQQSKLFILFDDFDTNLPKVKISWFKKKESHNGIKSIQNYLMNQVVSTNIFKLGIGIGPKPSNASTNSMADWVLSKFKIQEEELLNSKSFPSLILYVDHIIEKNGEIKSTDKLNSHIIKMFKND